MLQIKKLRADHVLDYAAEELKKYLRMMMPEGGDVEITYAPDAKDGFRLGLLEDFSLPFEGTDARLDDVIHIEAEKEGGILAGSNPRSVLFAVYRFLRENGCRWLYPGVDGDYVPMKEIEPVSYHKMASHRFRGFCNEGSESQSCMLECAEYYAKLEMNVYMLEWAVPNGYYNRFYTHRSNTANRAPEPVSDEQILQWKRQCEVEIAKRGLMFHDMGHGWTSIPFGFPGINTVDNKFDLSGYTEEQKQVLALKNGKRDFYRDAPIFTNVCMSRPHVRSAIANAVVEYSEKHRNVDYLHVWLSDGTNNHCECEECAKKIPSDWYIQIMNEIDEKLREKELDTRIVFIAYTDTMFAPQTEKIKNPERFSLLFAPIARDYQSSMEENAVLPEAPVYVRNNWKRPTTAESFAHLRDWKKNWKGPSFSYEYHFWRHQYLDPGGLALAKRLYEDVRGLRYAELEGYVEDGSQRSGFPNAFPVYIYAETLMNRDCDFEAVKEDYFSHIYGEDWREAESILSRITTAFDFGYMEGVKSKNREISLYYDPERVPRLQAIAELCAEEKALAEKHMTCPTRPQTVSWRLLAFHAEYCKLFSEILVEKARGHNFRAKELLSEFCDKMGAYEIQWERYYDHGLACRVLEQITGKPKKIILE